MDASPEDVGRQPRENIAATQDVLMQPRAIIGVSDEPVVASPAVMKKEEEEPEEGEVTEEKLDVTYPGFSTPLLNTSWRLGSRSPPTPDIFGTPPHDDVHDEDIDAEPLLEDTAGLYRAVQDIQEYEKNVKVGQGTFGEVTLATHKQTQQKVALKRIIVHKHKEGLPITSIREIIILKALKHRNIISLDALAFSRGDEEEYEPATIYLIFPYMSHDLYGLLKNAQVTLEPAQIKSFAHQTLEGLSYLHKNRLLHRDLKSANILIDDKGNLKIGDFGLARRHVTSANVMTTLTPTVVTLWYRPPEILFEERKYNTAVDMWGFACIFAEMWDRTPVFQAKNETIAIDKIFTLCGTPTTKDWPELQNIAQRQKLVLKQETRKVRYIYSQERLDVHTINFLDFLLTLNPAKRPTAEEALQHEYFLIEPATAKPGTADFPGWPESHEMAIQDRINGEQERAHEMAESLGQASPPPFELRLPPHADALIVDGVPTPRRALPVADGGLKRRRESGDHEGDLERDRKRSVASSPPLPPRPKGDGTRRYSERKPSARPGVGDWYQPQPLGHRKRTDGRGSGGGGGDRERDETGRNDSAYDSHHHRDNERERGRKHERGGHWDGDRDRDRERDKDREWDRHRDRDSDRDWNHDRDRDRDGRDRGKPSHPRHRDDRGGPISAGPSRRPPHHEGQSPELQGPRHALPPRPEISYD
ncbi:kinase-like domain-containing protein [Fimicolochytrium jonesii]|uniref:kinase-like domain-containing protein n=1 Tax=Fimicolochytrium jonesii TaxID=1396493 RepID=UPI0022FEA4B4|nr:kinase-like domain-containing protein [Fimicolochytrium jonesii]KAI8824370.1 kinase-like domain-containing protein [Fimicolochytrium jonesii]